MQALATRRILVGHEVVEVCESPDARIDATAAALQRYARAGAWIALFNALVLRSAPLRAE